MVGLTTPLVVKPTATWLDPDGNLWDITNTSPVTDLGYFTVPGPAGTDAPPYDYTLDALPGGGESVRAIRNTSAKITWPLHVHAPDHMTFITRYRTLKRAFTLTTHRGSPGTLTVTRPDGTSRQIDCFYQTGFEGNGGEDGRVSAYPVLTLLAPDGYWRDTQSHSEMRSFAAGTNFLNPFPSVSSAAVLGATTITNPGDVQAWPTWTINGPAGQVTATNNTTGKQFILTYTITAGQLITITTRPPTVRGPVGENLVNALSWPGAADLWPLESGINSVDFEVVGAGTGTSITLTYYPRYEGA